MVKVSIIPMMVPKRPIKGATTETIFKTQFRPSIVGLSLSICSAIFNSKVSVLDVESSSAILSILPSALSSDRVDDSACA